MMRLSRREFLALSASSAAMLSSGCYGMTVATEKVERFFEEGNMTAKNIRNIITKNNQQARLLCWSADETLKDAYLELENGKRFAAEDISFKDEKQVFQYKAMATGLEPGKQYRYRFIAAGDLKSSWHEFSTEKKDEAEFKFLLFPDSQSSDYTNWKAIAKKAYKENPDSVMFVNMGDITDNGQQDYGWQEWFRGVKPFSDKLLFAPVMGNHECYDLNWQNCEPRSYLGYFPVPDNQSGQYEHYFYSFDYGDVHFVMLNTEWDIVGEEMLDAERKWLKKDLAANKKKWTIAFFHRDVLQYAFNKNRKRQREAGISAAGEIFMPILEAYGVNLVFTAHLHTYRNHGHLKNFVRDESGPIYILTGLCGNCFYDNLWQEHPLDKFTAPQPDRGNYLTVTVSREHLTVKCFFADGKLMDSVTV